MGVDAALSEKVIKAAGVRPAGPHARADRLPPALCNFSMGGAAAVY